MTPVMDYDYYCARCDAPFCERVHIMNLALDNIDDEFCLNCLCSDQEQPVETFLLFIREYIHSRDCFLTPWTEYDASQCPGLASNAPVPCKGC